MQFTSGKRRSSTTLLRLLIDKVMVSITHYASRYAPAADALVCIIHEVAYQYAEYQRSTVCCTYDNTNKIPLDISYYFVNALFITNIDISAVVNQLIAMSNLEYHF